MRPYHLLQITDCHLGSREGDKLLGLNTDESLHDVLRMLQNDEQPDLIVATGDISNDGGVDSYERFLSVMRRYFPHTPLAWLPGNHDEPLSMDRVAELPIEAHFSAPAWNFIFLDSKIPMEEGGELQPSELLRLERELERAPDTPTIVFLHHQVVPVGSAWVDQYAVKNSDAFFAVLDKFHNVKAVSWGHVHQEFLDHRRGVALMATPSTCVQFKPNLDDFEVDTLMPGYRRYVLSANGQFDTQVCRVPAKDYAIDFKALGY